MVEGSTTENFLLIFGSRGFVSGDFGSGLFVSGNVGLILFLFNDDVSDFDFFYFFNDWLRVSDLFNDGLGVRNSLLGSGVTGHASDLELVAIGEIGTFES